MSYKRPGYVANAEVRKINEMISAREMQERDEAMLAKESQRLRLQGKKGDSGAPEGYYDDSSSEEDMPAARLRRPPGRPPLAPNSRGSSSSNLAGQDRAPPAMPSPALIHRVQYLDYGFTIGGDAAAAGSPFTLSKPSTVIALPNGDLCVANTGSDQLMIVSAGSTSGEVRTPLSTPEGSSGGALRQPRGIACDATALYVSEAGGSRVRKMRMPDELRQGGAETPRGAHIGGLRTDEGEGSGAQAQLAFPQGVTLSGGELFVCDCEDHRVVVYDALTMTYRRSFGGYGEEEGELSFPYGCVVIGEECIVADTANSRLSVFHKATGAFLRCLGSEGEGRGEFTNPRAVTFLSKPDPSGPNGKGASVLVTCERTRVQVLTLTGECLEVLEVPGAKDLW